MASERRRRRRPWFIGGTVSALAGLAAMIGYPLFLAATFETQSTDIVNAFPDERLRPPVLEGEAANALNVLLLGSDTRGEAGQDVNEIRGQRSDTMLLLHIPADRSSLQVMSIMRDSWVSIPGHGENKINAALSFGGVPLVVQTVEDLIGVRVDRVAIIDFEGFGGMTDALGGVTFNNPIAFTGTYGTQHRYEQGEITLTGVQALEYVRERQAFRTGDYQRVINQQAFVKGLLASMLRAETLTNPARIAALVTEVSPFLAVDQGFDVSFLAGLGFDLRDVRVDDVTFFTLPTTGTGTRRGQSVVLIDDEQLSLIRQALVDDDLVSYVPPPPPLS